MSTGTNGAERAKLHCTIWRIANDLRGSVAGSQTDMIVADLKGDAA